eukprot:2555189-Pleurochrysis_carterae.AAC.1
MGGRPFSAVLTTTLSSGLTPKGNQQIGYTGSPCAASYVHFPEQSQVRQQGVAQQSSKKSRP